jgi:hypothetical protein
MGHCPRADAANAMELIQAGGLQGIFSVSVTSSAFIVVHSFQATM